MALPNRNRSIAERRFIDQVLNEEGTNIIEAQSLIDRQFEFRGRLNKGRTYRVSGNVLTLRHNIVQRFRDMRKIGGKAQKSTRQHNRVIFGHFNNIIGKVAFGFTQATREAMQNELNLDINA